MKTTKIAEPISPARILTTLKLEVKIWLNRFTVHTVGVDGQMGKTICDDLPIVISVYKDANTHQGFWKKTFKIGPQKYDAQVGVTKLAFIKGSKWEITLSINEWGRCKPEASTTVRIRSLKQMIELKLDGPKTKQPEKGFNVGNKYDVPYFKVVTLPEKG